MLRQKVQLAVFFPESACQARAKGKPSPEEYHTVRTSLSKARVDFQPDRKCDDIPPAGPAAVASLGACISPPGRWKLVLTTTITNGYAFPLMLLIYATRPLSAGFGRGAFHL